MAIRAQQRWIAGAILEEPLWESNTSGAIDDLAGRNGPTIREGSFVILDGPNGNRYLGLPTGTTAQRPTSPEAGWMRWNTTIDRPEVWNGTEWERLRTSAGNVTYANLNANGGVGTGSNQVARGNHTH